MTYFGRFKIEACEKFWARLSNIFKPIFLILLEKQNLNLKISTNGSLTKIPLMNQNH